VPRFTIDLTQAAVDKLNVQVQRTNETQGTTLTLTQWIALHMKEIATAEDLAVAFEQLQRESQDDLAAASRAKREQLLQELESV
jgi:hypothetical protein